MSFRFLKARALGRLVFTGCLAALLAGHARAAVFTVDPTQSTVALSGHLRAGVDFPLTEQGAGSLSTRYGGTINAEVTATTIQFTGSSVIVAENSGDWEPQAGGDAGSAPANYGARASVSILATAWGAVRDVRLDVVSDVLSVADGSFDSTALAFLFPLDSAAALDYRVTGLFPQQGSTALAGFVTNRVSARATLTADGHTQTLTIPVEGKILFGLLEENDTTLILKGQLVATRSLGGQTPFEQWVEQFYPGVTDPAVIGPNADPDQDGIVNFVEFAFGLNPTLADPPLSPLTGGVNPADPNERRLQFNRPKGLAGVKYSLQVSGSLAGWADLSVTPEVTDLGGGQEQVLVRDTEPLAGQLARFVRLVVEPL